MTRERLQMVFLTLLAAIVAISATACGGDGAADAPEPATTADEAVKRIAVGLADNRPEVLWHALPESYQRDVTALVHDGADKADVELWNKTFSVVQKLSRVLDEKQDFILDHPMLASQMKDRAEAEKSWDAVVSMVDIIADSDLADLDEVRNMDVGEFVADVGGDLMESLSEASAMTPDDAYNKQMQKLRKMKVTLASSSGDMAMVRTEMEGMPATEEAYRRVEGKWLPASLVDEWPSKMAEMKQQVAAFSSAEMEENKQAALMQLSMVEGALDQLLAANSADEFNAAAGAMMGMAMGAMMSQGGGFGGPSMDSSPSVSLGPGMDDPSAMGFDQPVERGMDAPDVAMRDGSDIKIGYSGQAGDGSSRAGEHHPFAADRPIPMAQARNFVGERVWIERADGSDVQGRLLAVNDDHIVLEREMRSGFVSFELSKSDVVKIRVEEQ